MNKELKVTLIKFTSNQAKVMHVNPMIADVVIEAIESEFRSYCESNQAISLKDVYEYIEEDCLNNLKERGVRICTEDIKLLFELLCYLKQFMYSYKKEVRDIFYYSELSEETQDKVDKEVYKTVHRFMSYVIDYSNYREEVLKIIVDIIEQGVCAGVDTFDITKDCLINIEENYIASPNFLCIMLKKFELVRFSTLLVDILRESYTQIIMLEENKALKEVLNEKLEEMSEGCFSNKDITDMLKVNLESIPISDDTPKETLAERVNKTLMLALHNSSLSENLVFIQGSQLIYKLVGFIRALDDK